MEPITAATPTTTTTPISTTSKQIACVELWLDKDFNAANVHSLRASIVKESHENPDKPIILYIDSYGGHVDALFVLVDTLNEYPNVLTACMGTAMSCGAALLSCGAKRFISPNARIMIHDASSFSMGTVIDQETAVKELKRMNTSIRKLLAKNCGKTIKEINAFLDTNKDHYMTAKQALKFGLVDVVGIPRVIQTTKYDMVVT